MNICIGVLGWGNRACPIVGVPCAGQFILSPGILKSILSHIWCKLNLPIFLLSGGVVNPYVDEFLNCSGNAMVLPPYYLEVVLCGYVASSATVVGCV